MQPVFAASVSTSSRGGYTSGSLDLPVKRGLHARGALTPEQREERAQGLEAFLGVLVGYVTRTRLGETPVKVAKVCKDHCALEEWKPLTRYLSLVEEKPVRSGQAPASAAM